jgi:hypothetical protein
MKHLEPILETYVYNYCNMCNILIYFYKIDIKHLQHTSKTLKTYDCNMGFQRNVTLLFQQMVARRCGARGSAEVVGGARSSRRRRALVRATCRQIMEHGPRRRRESGREARANLMQPGTWSSALSGSNQGSGLLELVSNSLWGTVYGFIR